MIVVGILSIIIAIAVPTWLKARENTNSAACRENLSKIDQAKEVWALETNASSGATINWIDIINLDRSSRYLYTTPVCPQKGVYTLNLIGNVPTCSIGTSVNYGALSHELP